MRFTLFEFSYLLDISIVSLEFFLFYIFEDNKDIHAYILERSLF